ncbi:hypothetical protein [Streptomyces sp. NPDC002994]|uniref:hypothetical protein n=1 Tax=Streptomyces sp. NPDC002994 TaxID=3154441 RepID=UPI0033ABB2E5
MKNAKEHAEDTVSLVYQCRCGPAAVGEDPRQLRWRECGIAPTVPAGEFGPELAIRLIDGT